MLYQVRKLKTHTLKALKTLSLASANDPQERAKLADAQGDLFALGVTLYPLCQLLTVQSASGAAAAIWV